MDEITSFSLIQSEANFVILLLSILLKGVMSLQNGVIVTEAIMYVFPSLSTNDQKLSLRVNVIRDEMFVIEALICDMLYLNTLPS